MDGERPTKGVLCVKCARAFLEAYPFLRSPREDRFVDTVEFVEEMKESGWDASLTEERDRSQY